jgi:hypothetical protein
MDLKDEHELDVTRRKLRLLEERLEESKKESTNDPRVQELSQRSLERMINQMKVEIVRFEARTVYEVIGRCHSTRLE